MDFELNHARYIQGISKFIEEIGLGHAWRTYDGPKEEERPILKTRGPKLTLS